MSTSTEALFRSKVVRVGDCDLWTGPVTFQGYGVFRLQGWFRAAKAHLFQWSLEHNHTMPAPGFRAHCHCGNRNCVRWAPGHWQPVTSESRRKAVREGTLVAIESLTPEQRDEFRRRWRDGAKQRALSVRFHLREADAGRLISEIAGVGP